MAAPIAIFLDRDGTLIHDPGYLHEPDKVALLPGVAATIRALRDAGVLLFLFTNQSGPARGLCTIDDVIACNDRMAELIGLDAPFDGVCLATEPPDTEGGYRKPSPRFILETIEKLHLDPRRCLAVGDKRRDLEAALRASIRAVRISADIDDPAAAAYAAANDIPTIADFADLPQILSSLFPPSLPPIPSPVPCSPFSSSCSPFPTHCSPFPVPRSLMKNTVLTVTRAEAGASLQEFLARRLSLSRRAAKDLLDKRLVWVNRQCIWMAHHSLKAGDVVEAQAATPARRVGTRPVGAGPQVAPARGAGHEAPPAAPHIRVLSENPNYLFADKPCGVLSIGPGGMEEILRLQLGNPDIQAVHRLDRDTSGCMLFAKSPAALDAAISIFKTRRVKKLYQFVAAGRIENNPITITDPIDGQPAKTTIRRISCNDDATFGSARIETGRTHQIRIHLAGIRHPVLGDRVHGLKKGADPRLLRVPRQMLHATELELLDPLGRGALRAHSPLPADFRRCLQMFRL